MAGRGAGQATSYLYTYIYIYIYASIIYQCKHALLIQIKKVILQLIYLINVYLPSPGHCIGRVDNEIPTWEQLDKAYKFVHAPAHLSFHGTLINTSQIMLISLALL